MSMKKGILKDMIKTIKGDKRMKMMPDSKMSVKIMGDSPEAIKEGAEMVEDLMEGKGPMGEMMEMSHPSKKESYAEARKKSLKRKKS